MLVALAAYVVLSLVLPGSGSGRVVQYLRSAVGLAILPLIAVVAAVGVTVLAQPALARRLWSVKRTGGAALLATGILYLLGALGGGGRGGTGLYKGLGAAVGLAAPLLVLTAVIGGALLLGLPARVLVAAVRLAASVVTTTLAALGAATVAVLLWAGRSLRAAASRRTGGRVEPVWSAPAVVPSAAAPRAASFEDPVEETTQPLPRIGSGVADRGTDTAEGERRSGDWVLPSLGLLEFSKQQEPVEADARARSKVIEETLSTFGVEAYVREINPGPTVTQFAVEPGRGTKVSRITSLSNDLALALAAPSIRIEAPVPGQSRVGIEVPNGRSSTVRLRDVMDSAAFNATKGKLKLALGRDVTGKPVVGDLARMPHLLIAGATGSGKSVCLNSIIAGFLFQHTPDDLRFLMVDPKMVELKTFDGVPHLLWPVVTDVSKVVGLLKYAVAEMERRYKELSELGIRNLDAYNRKAAAEGRPQLPHMIVVIDELADMMMAAPEEVEAAICRLAQMARAVGIHLILATQRPSVDVLTGLIKANFPSRIAFAVSSQIDSRVILDMPGAERLLGRGDMLYLSPDSAKPVRVQGVYVSDDEIEATVAHWKSLREAAYDPRVGKTIDTELTRTQNPEEDPLYQEALQLAESHARLSTSLLQRKLRIGYNRAARLMDALRDSGDLDVELDA